MDMLCCFIADAFEFSLKHSFDDRLPPQDWKSRLKPSYFKHKQKSESLCLDEQYSPFWVDQAIGRRGFDVLKSVGKEQQLCNEETFNIVRLLKVCEREKNLGKGCELHAYISQQKLFEKNSYIASTIISMYARCGAVAEAQQVLNGLPLPARDVVAWNALIAGYAKQEQGRDALKCFDRMQREGCIPNAVTFTCALKACANTGAVIKGRQIHKKIVNLGILEKDSMLGSTLVDMYARCGALANAQELFDELPMRNAVEWTALIAGYAQQGQGEKALKCFDTMQLEGHLLDAVTFMCALKVCGSVGAVAKGEEIHDKIVSLGMLEKDVVLGNTLVDMYVRCAAFAKAKQLLDKLPLQDVVTWNTLIAGYAQQGQGEEALKLFDNMQLEGHSPNAVTFTCALKACGSIGAVLKGKHIHEKIVGLAMLEKDTVLGSALVDMYARCGALEVAQQALNELLVQDVVAWNAIIAGYVQQERGEEALRCFDIMQCEGHSPDAVTFSCAVKACGSIGRVPKGEEIHSKIVNLGMLQKNTVLGNTLVDMYARSGEFGKAQQVFDELHLRDIVTWNALLVGSTQQEEGVKALDYFHTMQHEGLSPNAVTFTCVLKACGSIGAVTKGKQIHEKIASLGMLHKDVLLGGSLVDMYARCGALELAQEVLDELADRDEVTWNALIAGYAEQEQGEEVLKCFNIMQCEGQSPNAMTFTYALSACGNVGAVTKGEEILDQMVSLGVLVNNIVLLNALMDMYASCGVFAKVQQVFDQLPVQDMVTWTGLIAGYAQQGQGEESLNCFERMQFMGISPGSATLVCLLNACSHSGLLDEAEIYFLRLCTNYGIMPDAEHCCCMIDVFSRAGILDKALVEIKKMACIDYLPFWLVLLGACHKWGDVKIGSLAFKHALCLDKTHAAAYVSMDNIYKVSVMQEDVYTVNRSFLGVTAKVHSLIVNA